MTTRDELREQVMATDWAELAPHAARGALILLAPDVDLLDVAFAIASDDTERVTRLATAGALYKPTDSEGARYAAAPHVRFQFVIVQPYVLAQALGQGAPIGRSDA